MAALLKILTGMTFDCAGFIRIAEDPVSGCCILLAGGLLILSGFGAIFDPRDNS